MPVRDDLWSAQALAWGSERATRWIKTVESTLKKVDKAKQATLSEALRLDLSEVIGWQTAQPVTMREDGTYLANATISAHKGPGPRVQL